MNRFLDNVRDFFRLFRAEFYVASGVEKTGGENLTLLWSGSKKQFAYFDKRIFESGTAKTKRIGRRPIYMSDNLSKKYDCSLSIVLLPERYLPFIKQSSDICLPLWVDCQVELCQGRTYATSDSIRADLRKIAKYRLSWERAREEAEVRHFFERIYLPTVSASHGKAVLPASGHKRLRQFASGKLDLINVVFEGEVVAGVTIDYRDKVPSLRDVGVLDASPAIKKMAAVTAANVFAMDYLSDGGYGCVNLGLSRSFLDDGVLNFKRKFMPIVTDGSRECILLRVNTLVDSVRSFLRASACISLERRNLCRTFFRDGAIKPSKDTARRHRSEWKFGIPEEVIFDVSGLRIRRLNTTSEPVTN
jgi:hypothetical protein